MEPLKVWMVEGWSGSGYVGDELYQMFGLYRSQASAERRIAQIREGANAYTNHYKGWDLQAIKHDVED